MRIISLSALTVLPCSPLEQIEAAAAAGFSTVSLRIIPVMDTDVDLLADAELMRAVEKRLVREHIDVFDVEVVRATVDTDVPALAPALEFAGRIGAKRFAVTSGMPEEYSAGGRSRLVDKLRELAEATAKVGVGVMLEFMPYRGVDTLAHAASIVVDVDHPGLAINVDALHFFRSGGRVDQLRGIDASLLACAQICDAPAEPPADLPTEARYGRLYPGKGGLPLVEFIRALPADLPVCVEAPRPRDGLPVIERALRAAKATRALLDAAD